MVSKRLPKLDKKRFAIASLHDETDEKVYWFSKTPQERIAATEVMRKIIYDFDPTTTRLQRVLEITEQT